MQWNLNVQRQIFRDTTFTVGYVGSRGVNLLSFRDYNPPQAVVDANGVQHFGTVVNGVGVSNPRLNPNFGTLTLSQPSSLSRYNALQVSVNERFSSSVQTYFSYTFSHCTDLAYTYGGLGGNNGTSAWNNPYDGSTDKGNCSYDIRAQPDVERGLPFAVQGQSPGGGLAAERDRNLPHGSSFHGYCRI